MAHEERVDRDLIDWRVSARFDPVWIEAGRRWSRAVWEAAETAGPRIPDARLTTIGVALARRPTFICGVHRSGTTLLRDLLDGHPMLTTLPAESNYFGVQERLPEGVRVRAIGEAQLRSLVNPNNQPPFWLLGRSTAIASPYVEFARAFAGWNRALAAADLPAAPLAAAALAFAQARGQQLSSLSSWVEKTPGTERHIGRIFKDFPTARVIHIIREPDAVARSYRTVLARANRDAAPLWRTASALIQSYDIARAQLAGGDTRYRLVRFETLVADRRTVMAELGRFLAIEASPDLLTPSIAGRPAEPNAPGEPAAGSDDFGLVANLLLGVARQKHRSLTAV